jgi:hypothetical protein
LTQVKNDETIVWHIVHCTILLGTINKTTIQKGDISMIYKNLEDFSNLGGTALSAYRTLISINEKAVQRLSQSQQDLISKSLEAGMEQWTQTGKAATLQDLLSSQAKVMAGQTEMLVDYAKTSAKILKETHDELQAWIKETTKPAAP